MPARLQRPPALGAGQGPHSHLPRAGGAREAAGALGGRGRPSPASTLEALTPRSLGQNPGAAAWPVWGGSWIPKVGPGRRRGWWEQEGGSRQLQGAPGLFSRRLVGYRHFAARSERSRAGDHLAGSLAREETEAAARDPHPGPSSGPRERAPASFTPHGASVPSQLNPRPCKRPSPKGATQGHQGTPPQPQALLPLAAPPGRREPSPVPG